MLLEPVSRLVTKQSLSSMLLEPFQPASHLFEQLCTQHPLVCTLVMQLLWAPVVCIVQEQSLVFAREHIRNERTLAVHLFVGSFTLCLQFILGLLVYGIVVLAALIRG